MRHKISQLLWLLPLLALAIKTDIVLQAATQYDQQVIAIMENDLTIQKAANFLYQKHDTTSYVVKWDTNAQMFERVKWNEQTQSHELIPNADPLPIGSKEWPKTRIQVVGHGDINQRTATIAGFSAENLADTLFNGLSAEDVGRISIVGCTRRREIGTSDNRQPDFLHDFMTKLGKISKTKTEVSVRSTLVSVDPNGKKLTGELVLTDRLPSPEVGIEWSRKNPSHKWIGKFRPGTSRYDVKKTKATASQDGLESHFFGILKADTDIYVSHTSGDTASNSMTYKIDDPSAFDWIDKTAQNTYMNADTARAPEVLEQIQFLTGFSQRVAPKPVRKLRGINDLLSELRYYGEAGPAQKFTELKYYRFGDWVFGLDPTNFYVSVEGVVTSPTDSPERTAKIAELKNSWKQMFPRALHKMPEDYPTMQPRTGDNFFSDVTSWINGQNENIGLEIENAYNAQCGAAMFLSESIRSFQTHVTNMMSLDLVHNGYLSKDYFFRTHPMARGMTWQIQKTGLDMLRDPEGIAGTYAWTNSRAGDVFKSIGNRISRISKSWLSHVNNDNVQGSRHLPPQAKPETYTGQDAQGTILSPIQDIGELSPASPQYLRTYELMGATDSLLSTELTEPVTESIDTQFDEFSGTEDVSSPLRASIAMANDHAYVSDQIFKRIQLKEQQTGKSYEIIPDSMQLGQNDHSVRFQVKEKANPSSVPEEITTTIDQTKLSSKEMLEDLQTKANALNEPTNPESKVSKINRGLAIYGVVRGLAGSISAFENGNVTQGAIGLAQSLHGIGELSGVNKAIYKATGEYLGDALRNQVKNVGESVTTIAGEETGNLARAAGGEVLSTVGEVGELLEDVPIVGTAFGIYNIYEDFQQHSTIGYIDAGLDIAITGLSLLGPEAEPVVLALTVIRMGIDSFYNEISKELKALPPNASTSQKVTAVFKGIGEAFQDLFEEFTIPGQIYGAITNSHKLDEQYHKDRSFLSMLSNYHNYFTIVKGEGTGATEINFAGGSESWNGGDITFHLGESGQSTLELQAVDSNGHQLHENHQINTQGVEDIVMGIGESHSISFKKQTAKFLWFIPVHSRTLISGNSGEKQTLHGTYYGNTKNNKFIAVQQLPPQGSSLGYNLHDYHYKLYGGKGDDIFYLGPQHSYVEGNDGSDTYFVSTTSTYTEINNNAHDGETDYLIFNLDYAHLLARRQGLNLKVYTADNTHTILIDNWFHDDIYQHMVFKTQDGVIFKISATNTGNVNLIPTGMSGQTATSPVMLDARQHGFSQVISLIGSTHDDHLYGNGMDNHLIGGEGDDTLTGGDGKDTYTIGLNEGIDTIDNYAVDGKDDILFLAATAANIVSFSSQSTNHLYLSRVGSTGSHVTGATVKNWFLNQNYRHLKLVSEDGVVLNISSTKDLFVSLHPLMVDMSQNNQRQVNLSSSSLLAEVITVFGSDQDDTIIGNSRDNYISTGKGNDILEGREGQDVYVVKAGDGNVEIRNFARDNNVDTILFDAKYDDIILTCPSGDLRLAAHTAIPDKSIIVTAKQWISGGAPYQHMLVRSSDGVVFELPTSLQSAFKIPKIIDNSKLTTNIHLSLAGKWSSVERVLGSQGNDTITGNSLINYMDPGIGRCELQGKNGSDSYVIRGEYGKGNVINNYAEDSVPDSVLFQVPFFSIKAKVRNNRDIQLTSITGKGHVNTRLTNYVSEPKSRHLTVLTEDGYQFVLPPTKNYKPVPIIINRAQRLTGQHINLTANSTFSDVRTVYGAKNHENCIIGNLQNNTLVGGSKADLLQGHDGNDVIKGGAGDDTLIGDNGEDTLIGGPGDDRLVGGNGDDVLSPGLGTNHVDGGNGTDTVIYSGNVTMERGIHLNLKHNMCIHEESFTDTLVSIENGYGTEFDDTLQGDEHDNVLVGQNGDDYLSPGAGYDILNGGNGNDTYDLSDANGTVILQNYATDRAWDKVIMTYANMTSLGYDKKGNDLVVRVIDAQYPVFYDASKPTVIFKGWFIDSRLYHHAYVDTADGRIESKFLKRHARKAAERAV